MRSNQGFSRAMWRSEPYHRPNSRNIGPQDKYDLSTILVALSCRPEPLLAKLTAMQQ